MPPDAAYALIANAKRRPEWMPELDETNNAPTNLQVGDRFDAATTVLMHTVAGQSEVTEADGSTTISERVIVGVAFTSTWRINGSTVEHTIDVDLPRGPFRWFEGQVLKWRLQRMQRRSLANLQA